MNDTPEYIRLKRRRDEGSVDRLLIDDEKRIKRGKFVFRLTKTVAPQFYEADQQDLTPLLKLANEDHRHFVLEQGKKRRRESSGKEEKRSSKGHRQESLEGPAHVADGLPPEISQMLRDHLTLNGSDRASATMRKRSKKHFVGEAAQVVSMPSLDYVYDIYHLEKVTEEEIGAFEKGKFGFVKIVNRDLDLVPDEESDPGDAPSDDQDSNEEDYYQNDYPEDEDDDRSILFGSEGEDVAADETAEHIQSMCNSELMASSTDDEFKLKEQREYAELFSRLGSSGNILNSLNAINFVDVDDGDEDAGSLYYEDYCDNETTHPKNTFFKSDEDDQLAAHRDKIFGELQRMIDRS